MTLPLVFENSLSSKLQLPLPPDLLRRFVSRPHCGMWCIAGVMFHVETNSPELLQTFALQPEIETTPSVRLKIVVDADIESGGDGEPFIIDSGQLCWGHARGLLFAFDRAAGELLMFVPEAQVQVFKTTFEELLRSVEPILAEEEMCSVASI